MRNNKNSNKQSTKRSNSYVCRLCRWTHPLRKCKKFLEMNVTERIQVVKTYGYCKNCLAHSHSQNTCFTTSGCRYCHSKHHSLLHISNRLNKAKIPNPTKSSHQETKSNKCPSSHSNRSPKDKSKAKSTPTTETKSTETSLSAILKQNTSTLLPTVVVEIEDSIKVRCLLDSGSKYSSISSKLVDRLKLVSYTLNHETICPVTLRSVYDTSIQITSTLRVNNRISLHTPSKSLPSLYATKFDNMMLADAGFFKSGPVNIILGADTYPREIGRAHV